jgi:2,3-dihydroxybenzoate decarboxylase
MVRKIAIEEHCLTPGFEEYWGPTVVDLPSKRRDELYARLTDFGEMRLAAMDKAGIARAVLALAGPGVQAEKDRATACRKARSRSISSHARSANAPDRYSAAHLPMQDAKTAADELERCIRELRLSRRDDQWPYERAIPRSSIALSVLGTGAGAALIYLHPADPITPAPCSTGTRASAGPPGNGRSETGSHALPLVFGGVFDPSRTRDLRSDIWRDLAVLLWRSIIPHQRISMRSSWQNVRPNTSRIIWSWRRRACAQRASGFTISATGAAT